jgi:alpha-tubulin suppressor-like RCC1 family protein
MCIVHVARNEISAVQVAVWGWNHGLAHLEQTLVTPTCIPSLRVALDTKLAAGRVHSLIAAVAQRDGGERNGTSDVLYAFGNGQNGRLGLGSSQSAAAPEAIPDFEGLRCLGLACGHDHSLVLAHEPEKA